jgi:hypothetical protein
MPRISKTLMFSTVVFLLAACVAAQTAAAVTAKICPILSAVYTVLYTIAGSLVIIMFVYGGLKYIFSADDPGGRKSGKNTCIHAIIGGIMVVIASAITSMIGLVACT